jgi:hypothetical protein
MTTNNPYEIKFENANEAKALVGKTLVGTKAEIKILEWVGQNYKLQMPDGSIKESPVMWVLQNIAQKKISVK